MDILITLFAIWFIGSCFVFLGMKVLEKIGEGISDHKTEDKKLAMIAIKWPVTIMSFLIALANRT